MVYDQLSSSTILGGFSTSFRGFFLPKRYIHVERYLNKIRKTRQILYVIWATNGEYLINK